MESLNVTQGPLAIFNMTFGESVVVLAIKIGSFLVGLILRSLIVRYIWLYAPKERPLNTLMLFNQVKQQS